MTFRLALRRLRHSFRAPERPTWIWATHTDRDCAFRVVGVVAAWLPARRAARVDPAVALRST